MYILCIVVAFMDILYSISAEVYLIYAWNSQPLCQATVLICAHIYGFSIFFTFLFLWWRQRGLYTNRYLKQLFNRATRSISWMSILVIAAFGLLPTLSQGFWRQYSLTDDVCFAFFFLSKGKLSLRVCGTYNSSNLTAASNYVMMRYFLCFQANFASCLLLTPLPHLFWNFASCKRKYIWL